MGWPFATVLIFAFFCATAVLTRAIDKRNTPPPDTHRGLDEILRDAGDNWGPLGVALEAAKLTDRDVLIAELTHPRGGDWEPTPSSPS